MTKERILEAVTGLLISKIQFDARFEAIDKIIQAEEWEKFEEFRTSVQRSIVITAKMQARLLEIKDIIDD
ncbi:hypothetical protein C900_05437 [Fulvivirga imtechensis AK7]|uniref:Uncharacterized protein n=1 Tax=Fulvivirga imtechensis AK7 TaxID=1237149 RepID=L8JLC3_9BACT|nr:hypothetical protein [Fulvivirga imtechensis]ELR69048.1 hypothetical protein C900_05437 [Fulvivirga imtechensis AK7]